MNKQQKKLLVSSALTQSACIGLNLLTVKYVNGKENPGKFWRFMRWHAKLGLVAGPVLGGMTVAACYMVLESPVDVDTQTYEVMRRSWAFPDESTRDMTGSYVDCMRKLRDMESVGLQNYFIRVVDGTERGI